MGLVAMFALILFSAAAAWLCFPILRANSTLSGFAAWILTVACCAAAFHAISILASTVLDEYWHVWASMLSIGLLKWLTVRFPPPPSLDVFRVMAEASPLRTHSLPWPAILVSLSFAALVFAMAAKLVETREY
jgi:hypothetical protein